eukprot:CAMPEP_0177651442 /NCGR_PEP_ID=MMETSP0447-20121125/12550_1 /TAXON_ID=0 /ORGANISM="Stygamoeba regulata, Strain BSH-02190019" /LENGTH=535 /DNA_ID=CAMNT_0019154523 /DNA_START=179 /DNA_END=1786 /DNA_ORIENTATION=+
MARWCLLCCLLALAVGVSCHAAQDWFLSKDEISSARHGVERQGIAEWTTGNSVTPLVDGASFMAQLFADIEAAQKGDFVHGCMFDQDPDMLLVPDPANPTKAATTRFATVLTRAVQRGVRVRLLGNINLYLPTKGIQFCKEINAACAKATPDDSTCCAPDSRHFSSSGSAHAKSWVVQRGGETVAYTGGLDVAQGRWDDSTHSDDPDRQSEPPEVLPFWGFHDMMMYVRGPAVRDLARHFWLPPVAENPGSLAIQMLQTFGCNGAKNSHYYQNFAPKGEYTFSEAFYKLVKGARNFLYLADQFMYFDEPLKAVADALPNLSHLVIVTDPAYAFSVEPIPGWNITLAQNMRLHYQYKSLSQLLKDPVQAKKVHIFDIGKVHSGDKIDNLVYVHSKLYIADDEFVIVGSAGIERAGFTNDIEMSIGIFDAGEAGSNTAAATAATVTGSIRAASQWDATLPARAPFAQKLRTRLWSEFLSLPADDPRVVSVDLAVEEFERQAANGTGCVRHYYPTETGDHFYYRALYDVYEPEGRCDS